MSFTSPVFFLFLPVVLLLYRLCQRRGRILLLLASSYLFYAYYDIRLLILILITTLTSYYAGISIAHTNSPAKKRRFVALTMVVCLGILFFFKYFNFALDTTYSLVRLFGLDAPDIHLNILLPMGISFYTFQTMSYIFDVYAKKIHAERNIGYYALFVVFFPQLVAGPIERPADLIPQLRSKPTPSKEDYSQGLAFLLRGYAKKIILADTLSGYVDTAYGNIPTAGGAALILATVLFAIQIYCDFSGYSDIALGCARFLGIRLTENFHRPYQAVTIRDFWRRWHISLTRWFRDYLYIPLGGNRKGLPRQCVNILLTFLVSGLWHGANLTYVLWGGIHGIYLIIETLLLRKKELPKKYSLLGQCITFPLVCFAWIFFRAPSVNDACLIIATIFTHFDAGNLLDGIGATRMEFLLFTLSILLLPALERLPSTITANHQLSSIRIVLLYYILVLTIVLFRIMVLTTTGSTSFIYFQF